MTVPDLMTVLSFGLTCFANGYAFGVNCPIKNDRHGLSNCAIIFRNVLRTNRLSAAPFMSL